MDNQEVMSSSSAYSVLSCILGHITGTCQLPSSKFGTNCRWL